MSETNYHQSESDHDEVCEFFPGQTKAIFNKTTWTLNGENEEIKTCVLYDNETQSSRIKDKRQMVQMS